MSGTTRVWSVIGTGIIGTSICEETARTSVPKATAASRRAGERDWSASGLKDGRVMAVMVSSRNGAIGIGCGNFPPNPAFGKGLIGGDGEIRARPAIGGGRVRSTGRAGRNSL